MAATAQGSIASVRHPSYGSARSPSGPGVARTGPARRRAARPDRPPSVGAVGGLAPPGGRGRAGRRGAQRPSGPAGLNRSPARTVDATSHSSTCRTPRRGHTIERGRRRCTATTRIRASSSTIAIGRVIPNVCTLRHRWNSIASRRVGGGWPRSPRIRSRRVLGTRTSHPPPGPSIRITSTRERRYPRWPTSFRGRVGGVVTVRCPFSDT